MTGWVTGQLNVRVIGWLKGWMGLWKADYPSNWLAEWLAGPGTGLQSDWLGDWLFGCVSVWLTDLAIDWLAYCLSDRLTWWVTGGFVKWLAEFWVTDLLTEWLDKWAADCHNEFSERLTGRVTGLVNCWLVDKTEWLAVLLSDWPIDWLCYLQEVWIAG